MDASRLATARTVAALRAHLAAWRQKGETVALVPTMGALHEGHVSLVRLARVQADRVVASIFVNPRQFGPDEDFERYPRAEQADGVLLAQAGCDMLYAPGVEAIYPPGYATTVSVGGVSAPLEGAHRAGHFDGMATVVLKLLLQCAPDVAIFGEKDFQQLAVIRRMARDLDLPTDILGAPIARAPNGLALSSRNAYLAEPERAVAPALHAVLVEAAAALARGVDPRDVEARSALALAASGFTSVDYVAVCDPETLQPATALPARILAAAWLGKTRLIDNVAAG